MNIIVCVKQTLDTAAKIEIVDGKINTKGVPRIINPYDEFAIEEALRIKEKREGTQITLITVGSEKSSDSLKTGLAMGADEAVHVLDSTLGELGGLIIAKVLAKAIQGRPFDMILCGRQAVDDDMAQVGPALAILLDIPFVSVITKLDLEENAKRAIVARQIEAGSEILEVPLPVLLTCQKGLNEPRLPSLKGIMKAKKKAIQVLDAKALDLKPEMFVGDHSRQIDLTLPLARKKGIIFSGGLKDAVASLATVLRDDLKVI